MLNIFTCLLLSICVYGVCGRVIVAPQNMAIIRGERLSLECRAAEGSIVREWFRRQASQEMKIFTNWGTQWLNSKYPQYGVDVDDNGSGILYSNETQLEDGGTYGCAVATGDGITRFLVEITVLEPKPICNLTDYNNGRFQVVCSINFSGNWVPKIEWKHHSIRSANEDGVPFTNEINTFVDSNRTRVVSTLTALLYSEKDSFTVSCKVYFARSNDLPSRSTTNVPTLSLNWRSPVIGKSPGYLVTAAASQPNLSSYTGSEISQPYSTISGHFQTAYSAQSQEGQYKTMSLIGGITVFVLILCLVGVTSFLVCRRNRKVRSTGKLVVNFKERESASADIEFPNVYESILFEDNGYLIPFQYDNENSGLGDPPSRYLPLNRVLKSTENRSDGEPEKLGKNQQISEASEAVRISENEYAKMRSSVDRLGPKTMNDDSMKNVASYIEIIDDKEEDSKTPEQLLSSCDNTKEISSPENSAIINHN